jgi:hypothetical protein
VYQCFYLALGEYNPVVGPAGSVEVCADSYENAIDACETKADGYDPPAAYNNAMDAQLTSCHQLPAASCTGWNPSAYVSFNTMDDVYEIDSSFVDDLIGNPALLTSCDDGRFNLNGTTGMYYLLDDVSSGDLLDELGLQDGDMPTQLNGIDLEHWDDVADAFFLVLNGETEFRMAVSRSSSTVYIEYKIVP